jgi:hypothetical protein
VTGVMRSMRTKAAFVVAGGVAGYVILTRAAGPVADRARTAAGKVRALGDLGVEHARHAAERLNGSVRLVAADARRDPPPDADTDA